MLLLRCFFLLSVPIAAQDGADFPKEIQAQALTATVRVANTAKKSAGSGVIVGRIGAFVYVLTAQHVVAGAEGVDITVFPGKDGKTHKVYRDCRVLATSADARDLALVRVATNDKTFTILPILPVGETPKTRGLPCLAIGCSDGEAPSALVQREVGKKQVRKKADKEKANFWETPGAVAKGRSGGPLIDKRGFVIGICSGTNDGKGYYTHAQEIHRFLKEHGFPWLAEKDGAR